VLRSAPRVFASSGSLPAVFLWGVFAACALLACGRSGFAICHRFCKFISLVSSFLKASLFLFSGMKQKRRQLLTAS
jgi:hypothetical protein